MSDRVYWFTITIPLLTHIASPQTTNMTFNPAEVESISVIVPPGPAGSVGFQIWNGGGAWLPQSKGQYIVADDYNPRWMQNKAPNNGNWQFVAYNEDFVAHTLQVGFEVNDFVTPITSTSSVIGL